jgi:methylase of polypeptide subunit release factors
VTSDLGRPAGAHAAPPSAPDPAAAAQLRDALEEAGFTVERVEETLGVGELSGRPAETAVHLRRLAGSDPFDVVARLFLLGATVGEEEARAAIRPLRLLTDLGVVEAGSDGVRAFVRLVPHGDYYVASDPADAASTEAPDWVPGIQAPSVTLAKLAVRQAVGTALDLGTGCGIQALLAAKHAEQVVATDVSPRALAFAAFNTALNGVANVELRQGDLFDAVRGERFDLIVANPPYVVSPDSSYLYRDGGRVGDELCRLIVETASEHLAEGGFAHLLVAWADEPGGDPFEPLREWVQDSGCDAWLLHYSSEDPLTHAASWLRPLADTSIGGFETGLGRWLAYLRDLGIASVASGAVVLRRRSGARNWVRTDDLPLDRLEPAGEHTLRVFAAEDLLAGLPDGRALLGERLALVDAHRLEQRLACRDGRFEVESQTLVLTDGLGFHAGLDRNTAALLPHIRSDRTLAEGLAAAATDLGVDEADRDRYVAAALPVVRRLLELGFLVP